MEVEKEISEYLQEKGLRQKWLAEQIGISASVLSMVLSQKRKMRLEEYLKICEVLEVEVGYFLKPTMPDKEK